MNRPKAYKKHSIEASSLLFLQIGGQIVNCEGEVQFKFRQKLYAYTRSLEPALKQVPSVFSVRR